MNIFENFFGNAKDDGTDRVKSSTRLTLRSAVGAYIAYLGWKLITGAEPDGDKPVPEWLKIVLGVLFIAAGAGFICYALYAFYQAYKASKLVQEEEAKALSEEKAAAEAAGPKAAVIDGKFLQENEKYLSVKELYQRYYEEARQAEERSKPTDGLLGLGNSPKKAPCHEDFYNSLSERIDQLISEDITPQEACAIAGHILKAPAEYRDNETVFPMLYAATGLAAKLAERLDPKDADMLAIEYSENFPKPERMPAQEKTLRALYDRARVI